MTVTGGKYRFAERTYQAGDFEKAEVACRRALEWDPSHAPARALFMEVQFILGRGRAFAAPYMGGPQVISHPQSLIEIDQAFARADQALGVGDAEAAGRELRKILEFAKWMPTGVEVAARAKRASEGLKNLSARRCDR